MNKWDVDSWQQYDCLQMPFYPYSSVDVRFVCDELRTCPGLVSFEEVQRLKTQLIELTTTQSFLLHAGTCAETFAGTSKSYVQRQVNLLHILAEDLIRMRMSFVGPQRVIKIGRLAGQFGKPRTALLQQKEPHELLNYFGDIINQRGDTPMDRQPNAAYMLQAYHHSAAMIQTMRQLEWEGGVTKQHFLSHEAFLLPYESALTRQKSLADGWYNLSTHFPWIGKRSIYPNSPHIEYLRGIQNPVGVKVSESISPAELVSLLDVLNPHNELGKIVLIHRFGVNRIAGCLPQYIKAVQGANKHVIWMVDPMHGNTEYLVDGRKFRNTQKILRESILAATIHFEHGSYLAGIHLECVDESILECAANFSDIDLAKPYTSVMDPRLNLNQSRDLLKQFNVMVKQMA